MKKPPSDASKSSLELRTNRREFLYTSLAAGSLALPRSLLAEAPHDSAADDVSQRVEVHEFVQRLVSYRRAGQDVVFTCTTNQGTNVDIVLSVCSPEVLRVRMCPDPVLREVGSLLEIKEDWAPSAFQVTETGQSVVVDAGVLRFVVQRDPWMYRIQDPTGKVLLQEFVRDQTVGGRDRAPAIGFTTDGDRYVASNESFALDTRENLYGFGEKFIPLNKRGQRLRSWNTGTSGRGEDAYKNIPFFLSTRGYGILVNSTFPIDYEMGTRSAAAYMIQIEDPRLDLFFMYGPHPKEVLGRYAEVSGWPALPPLESFGLWNSPENSTFEGYPQTVDEVVSMARLFRDRDLPLDLMKCVTLTRGDMATSFEETRELARRLGELGIRPTMHINPLFNRGTRLERETRAGGFAIMREDGTPYEMGIGVWPRTMSEPERAAMRIPGGNGHPCLMPDFTNPAAIAWWKKQVVDLMEAGCFSVATTDFGEAVPIDAHFHNGRDGHEMHNVYTQLYQKATYEATASVSPDRAMVMARSGTAGLQRYPICWSGDPISDWPGMLSSMRGGLSIGLSGVPFWSCNNGGFNVPRGDLSEELYIRWTQLTTFQSHTRLTSRPPLSYPWVVGDAALENFRKYIRLRYRLLPYIYSHAYQATQTAVPLMRAMVLEFPEDPHTYHMDDQYLFGDAFMVAPIYTPEDWRTVYLPEGTWFDYWTEEEHQGPTTLRVDPPLDVLPLYVRADTIIPMWPEMLYVGEKPADPVTLDIRLRSRAEFTIHGKDEVVACTATRNPGTVVLEVGASRKNYLARLNRVGSPSGVSHNGVGVPRLASLADVEGAEAGWYVDPSATVYVRFSGRGGSRIELQV